MSGLGTLSVLAELSTDALALIFGQVDSISPGAITAGTRGGIRSITFAGWSLLVLGLAVAVLALLVLGLAVAVLALLVLGLAIAVLALLVLGLAIAVLALLVLGLAVAVLALLVLGLAIAVLALLVLGLAIAVLALLVLGLAVAIVALLVLGLAVAIVALPVLRSALTVLLLSVLGLAIAIGGLLAVRSVAFAPVLLGAALAGLLRFAGLRLRWALLACIRTSLISPGRCLPWRAGLVLARSVGSTATVFALLCEHSGGAAEQ